MKGRLFFLALIFIGCNKDKFQTEPQLRLLDVSNKMVPVNGGLTVKLVYTDKQGDVSDSLFMRKVRLNRRATATIRDTLRFSIPDFPAASKGELELNINYTNLQSARSPLTIPNTNPRQLESDTLNLYFYVKDNEKNKSDTVLIEGVIVQRQ